MESQHDVTVVKTGINRKKILCLVCPSICIFCYCMPLLLSICLIITKVLFDIITQYENIIINATIATTQSPTLYPTLSPTFVPTLTPSSNPTFEIPQ